MGVLYANATDAQKQEIDTKAKELLYDNYRMTINLEDAFNSNKDNLTHLLSMVADDYNIDNIENNKYKILVGLSYMTRYYDIKVNDKNIRDELLNSNTAIKSKDQILTGLVDKALNYQYGYLLDGTNTNRVFKSDIKNFTTNYTNLPDFLLGITSENGINDVNDWFKETSKAVIVETPSKVDNNGEHRIFQKLVDTEAGQVYLLPLLTVPDNSIYAITNPTTISFGMIDTYAENGDEFLRLINKNAEQQGSFIDFWKRIAKNSVKPKLDTNDRFAIDSLRIEDSNPATYSSLEWAKKDPKNNTRAMNSFILPLNLYRNYLNVGAEASGGDLRYFMDKALSDNGLSAYGHEVTHILEDSVFFDNKALRDGFGGEFYARGLFESYVSNSDEPIMNFNTILDRTADYNEGKSVYTNKTPERFQNESDLKDYMSGVFDVINLMDKYEAEVVLSKNDVQLNKKWFNKIEEVADPKRPAKDGYEHKNDNFSPLSDEEAASLKPINDLVDHNIVAGRYEFKGRDRYGVAESNGYHVVPLFSPIYAAVTNDKGVSGDITSRRTAHKLLAEFGYYDGMVPYISNQYKTAGVPLNDIDVLTKIFNGKYTDEKIGKRRDTNK